MWLCLGLPLRVKSWGEESRERRLERRGDGAKGQDRGRSEGGAALSCRVPRDLCPPSAYQSQGGKLGHRHSPACVPIRPAHRTGKGDPSIPDTLLCSCPSTSPGFEHSSVPLSPRSGPDLSLYMWEGPKALAGVWHGEWRLEWVTSASPLASQSAN